MYLASRMVRSAPEELIWLVALVAVGRGGWESGQARRGTRRAAEPTIETCMVQAAYRLASVTVTDVLMPGDTVARPLEAVTPHVNGRVGYLRNLGFRDRDASASFNQQMKKNKSHRRKDVGDRMNS